MVSLFLRQHFLDHFYAIFVETIDSSVLAVSFSWSAFLISTTFFTYIISQRGDSVKEKEYLLMGGFLIRGVSWILFIFAGNIFHLIMIQILIGIGEAFGSPSFNAIFAEHLDKGLQIKQYSTYQIINNMITAVAVIIGGFVIASFGFVPLFIAMSSLAFISFLGVLLQPRDVL